MRPGGHLATAVALSGTGYGITGSAELAAGCFAGAFMIDVDHYLDYLTVEGQWRRPGPARFLRYYFAHRYHRLVLPLHSIELMSALVTLAVAWPRLALVGYVTGALLHLLLDVLVNGQQLLLRPVLFYSIAYRARLGFSRDHLVDRLALPPHVGDHPVREFFTWRPTEHRLESIPVALESLQAASSKIMACRSTAIRQGRAVPTLSMLGVGAHAPHRPDRGGGPRASPAHEPPLENN